MSKFDNILVTVLAVAAGIGVYCLLPSTSKEPLTLTEEHVIERNISAQAYGFSNDDAEIKSIEVDGRECIAIIGKNHSAISCRW
ncbi:MAG: hypothetical protein IJR46_08325 [Neisseriaceae bacterium]|nr:hypothetical protein [Neisseriaceae bacterium]